MFDILPLIIYLELQVFFAIVNYYLSFLGTTTIPDSVTV